MNGLASVGTILLEPIMRYQIVVEEEHVGKILGKIIQMRGTFETSVLPNSRMLIESQIPLAESMDFPVYVSSHTGGSAVVSASFEKYAPCPPDVKAERTRVGVNPLDRSKWILSMRNAL